MLEINVESGEAVNAQAVDLGNVVLVACDGARRRCTGERDILDMTRTTDM